MKSNFNLVIQFLHNPTYKVKDKKDLTSKIKLFLLILLSDLILVRIVIPLQYWLSKWGHLNLSEHKVNQLFSDIQQEGIVIGLAMLIIIIPIVEEFIFRLPLIPKKKYFIPLVLLGILGGCLSISGFVTHSFSTTSIFTSIGISAIAVYFLNHKRFTRIIIYNYRFFFYLMAILFALLHITNYKFSCYILLFSPVLVLPQFILGIFCSLCRIKLGFIWGVLLHTLHNAIFLLPFLFIISKPCEHKLIEKIDSESYIFEVHDGNAFNKEGGITLKDKYTSTSKITPDEIILHGSLKTIVSKLAKTPKRRIEFKNELIANKYISLYFKNDSLSEKLQPGIAQRLVLENILEAYNLKMKKETKPIEAWRLTFNNEDLFSKYITTDVNISPNRSYRGFQGAKDTLKLENINAKGLSKVLQINYNIEVKNELDNSTLFSVKIPNTDYKDLKKYFKDNYGIQINKEKIPSEFVIIE